MAACRRPPAYEPTVARLEIIRVEVMSGAYCPPPLAARWSPTAGAFVIRETGPKPLLVEFVDWFVVCGLVTLGLWALGRIVTGAS